MNDLWICTAGSTLVIRCVGVFTYHEVRQFASRKMGVDPAALDIKLCTEDKPANVEVRWVGDDYAHGGTNHGRRLQERKPGTEKWTDA